jgi:hypothetical protein
MNVPRWVPRHSFSVTMHDSSAEKDAPNSHREVGKALPMLAIAFGSLHGAHERFRRADDVVEAVRRHAAEQRIDIMHALGADVFAQDLHAFGRNRHFGLSARCFEWIAGVRKIYIARSIFPLSA